MRNRRVNVYNNTNLNQVVTDYRAGTPLKNINTQEEYRSKVSTSIPGGFPTGDVKVPIAGTRISRVRGAPIGGYRKTLAKNADGNCCADGNKNGFTQEIYRDTWTDCDVCVGDLSGNVARPSRTKKPLIRSGMQYNAAAAPNKLRNADEQRKKYAFSYAQYQKNLRCLSYERSQEKYKTPEMVGYPEKYRKSGCNSCCNCCSKKIVFKVPEFVPPGAPPPPPAVGATSAKLNGAIYVFEGVYTPFGIPWVVVARINGPDPCPNLQDGDSLTFPDGVGGVITITVNSPNVIDSSEDQCTTTRGENITVYKPNNKKFQVQGAVSSGSRLERLKLDTIQGSRIQKRISNGNCDQNRCNTNSKQFTQGYRSSEPRFVTNPLEGGAKTRGFVPTRWRQAYLAHGRSIGNIFQRTSSNNISGSLFSDVKLPYTVGSIKAGGCCHPPNAGTTN